MLKRKANKNTYTGKYEFIYPYRLSEDGKKLDYLKEFPDVRKRQGCRHEQLSQHTQ